MSPETCPKCGYPSFPPNRLVSDSGGFIGYSVHGRNCYFVKPTILHRLLTWLGAPRQ